MWVPAVSSSSPTP
ncbi:hypothetical protein LEMLEM_LOCUS5409 [Lemmus lemmus]